jgi:hypothetical protein
MTVKTTVKATDLGYFDWNDHGDAKWKWRDINMRQMYLVDQVTKQVFDTEDLGAFKVKITQTTYGKGFNDVTVTTCACNIHATRHNRFAGVFTAEIHALKWIDRRYRVEMVEKN